MPDFDVDFCQERRDEVIRYVRERYGSDRVAQIITFGKLQARAALRDAGRVLQVPYGQVDRLSKLVPSNPTNPVTLKKAIANEPLLAQAAAQDGTVRRMLDIAQQIEGLYRNVSTHAAGIVIGDRPLEDLVPLYKDPRSSMPATQFNMKDVEKAGLVKFDFLGLKTLSVLKRAQTLLARRGIAVDLDHLPLNDEKTFAMLSQGSATGVFQMEGSGMRDMLRRLKPDRFEDLIAVVALYRPGPMDNIPRYIGCKHGLEEHDYLDPSLEPILKETFGIMVYQEQVMQIAQVLAGYSLGSADLLRRAMGKKIKEEMEAQRKDFISGAMRNGVSAERAERIFEQVEKFAGYGFNKSHAAAYALIAYQTAWLKANYPVEFFAASMAYDMGNTDKLSIFRQALNELDIQVLPPDINASDVDFSVEALADGSLAVRYALAAVKNVGHGPVSAIVAERQANGAYASLADFCNRIDPRGLNKRQLEALIAAGAFDSLNKNRRLLFEGADHILRHAHAAFAAKTSQQSTLFGAESRASDLALPTVPDWPPIERLQQEYGAVGFYLSAHPLDAYRSGLRRLDIVPFANLADYLRARSTSRARLAGIVTSRQERISAKGNRFAFVQMTDLTGQFEVTVFTDRLTQYRDLLEIGKAVIVTAEIRQEEQDMRLIADRIESLDQAVQDSDTGLLIRLRSEEALSPVKTAIDRAGRGKGKIALSVELDELNQTVRLQLPGKWAVTPALTSELSGIPGVGGLTEI
jgi:DNA polymerase-3 subunit alpha